MATGSSYVTLRVRYPASDADTYEGGSLSIETPSAVRSSPSKTEYVGVGRTVYTVTWRDGRPSPSASDTRYEAVNPSALVLTIDAFLPFTFTSPAATARMSSLAVNETVSRSPARAYCGFALDDDVVNASAAAKKRSFATLW